PRRAVSRVLLVAHEGLSRRSGGRRPSAERAASRQYRPWHGEGHVHEQDRPRCPAREPGTGPVALPGPGRPRGGSGGRVASRRTAPHGVPAGGRYRRARRWAMSRPRTSPARRVTVRTLHSGSVTVGIHSRTVTEPVLAAMNQMAAATISSDPMVRSLMARPLTVTVGGPYAPAELRVFRDIPSIIGPAAARGDFRPPPPALVPARPPGGPRATAGGLRDPGGSCVREAGTRVTMRWAAETDRL